MSKWLLHTTREAMLLFAAVLLAFVCVPLVCAPDSAWAADDTATITTKVRLFQEYRVSASGLENEFTYQIIPREDDSPLPLDESGNTFDSFTLTRDDDIWLEFAIPVTMSYSANSYSYYYTLQPAKSELSDGLYYVDVQSTSLNAGVNVYYLELHVQLSSTDAALAVVTPLVHVDGWDGPKVSDPGWRVGYKAPDNPSSSSSNSGGYTSRSPIISSGSSISNSSSSSSNSGSGTSSGNSFSSGSSTNGSPTSSATSAKTSSASSSKLAKTGDTLSPLLLTACIASAISLLLACACLLFRRAGNDDE